jgi:DNA-binding MarR family transcriptional regulator
MQKNTIEIRDLRQQHWLWMSKVVLFHKSMDGNTFKVYAGLSSYANNITQEAFPSIATLTKKLHLGRNTVLRGLGKLEKNGFIAVERKEGQHNVYILLSIELEPIAQQMAEQEEAPDSPKERARKFFDGVIALTEKQQVPWLQELLATICEKNPNADKKAIWDEVKLFTRYWMELNPTGTKQRWQMEKTFEVEQRLGNWFRNKKDFRGFSTSGVRSGKAKGIIGLTHQVS